MDSDYVSSKEFSPFPDRDVLEAEREEIRRQVKENIDILETLVSHYDEAIEAIKSKQTTPLELTLFPKRHAIHTRAEKRLLNFIENERSYVKSLLDEQ